MGGAYSMNEGDEKCVKNSDVLPHGKRPLRKPRRWFENNIKMLRKEIDWRVWTGLILLRAGTNGARL
jgi:hypothetical protein